MTSGFSGVSEMSRLFFIYGNVDDCFIGIINSSYWFWLNCVQNIPLQRLQILFRMDLMEILKKKTGTADCALNSIAPWSPVFLKNRGASFRHCLYVFLISKEITLYHDDNFPFRIPNVKKVVLLCQTRANLLLHNVWFIFLFMVLIHLLIMRSNKSKSILHNKDDKKWNDIYSGEH